MTKRLNEEKLNNIFNTKIIPSILNIKTETSKEKLHPRAIILGGQPGSGKSYLSALFEEINKDFLVINGDDFRGYHPDWIDLLNTDDMNASDLIQEDCNFWIEKCIEEAIKQKINLIIEGTMRTVKVPVTTATKLKEAGYNVEAVIVSCPYEISIASMFNRYETQKSLNNYGRFTKIESHHDAFNGIPNTIKFLSDSEYIDGIQIWERNGINFRKLFSKISTDNEFKTVTGIYINSSRREITQEEELYIEGIWKNVESLANERKADISYLNLLEVSKKLKREDEIKIVRDKNDENNIFCCDFGKLK